MYVIQATPTALKIRKTPYLKITFNQQIHLKKTAEYFHRSQYTKKKMRFFLVVLHGYFYLNDFTNFSKFLKWVFNFPEIFYANTAKSENTLEYVTDFEYSTVQVL